MTPKRSSAVPSTASESSPNGTTPPPAADTLTLDDLLPHRPPMRLIDEVVEVGEGGALTRSRVGANWPLAGEGGVSPLVLIELAAQSAGVCNGWQRIRDLGRDSKKEGWLVAVKKAEFHCGILPLGMVVTARAANTMAFDKFVEVTSRLHSGPELLAEVVLQVYQE